MAGPPGRGSLADEATPIIKGSPLEKAAAALHWQLGGVTVPSQEEEAHSAPSQCGASGSGSHWQALGAREGTVTGTDKRN